MQKYVTLNPDTGSHVFHDTPEQAIEAFNAQVIALAKSYFHNAVYAVVTYNADGSETWENQDGEHIMKVSAQRVTEHLQTLLPKDKLFKVEIIE